MRHATIIFPFILMACPSDRETFTPQEGSWTESLFEIEEDSCNFWEGLDLEEAQGELTMFDDGSGFTFNTDPDPREDRAETGPTFTCDLEGRDFTCEPEIRELDFNEALQNPLDAVLIMSSDFSGSFKSETAGHFVHRSSAECEGPDCDILADEFAMDFPCAGSLTSEAKITNQAPDISEEKEGVSGLIHGVSQAPLDSVRHDQQDDGHGNLIHGVSQAP